MARPKVVVIRDCNIEVVLVGDIVAYSSMAVVLRVCTLHASCVSISASPVGSFSLYSKLPIEISLVAVIILDRVVVIFKGFVYRLFYS